MIFLACDCQVFYSISHKVSAAGLRSYINIFLSSYVSALVLTIGYVQI